MSDVFGNLRVIADVDPTRLHGWEVICEQFRWTLGRPVLVECIGCHRRSVTASDWARGGMVQCDNWQPSCRDLARWGGTQEGSDFARAQSAEWSRQFEASEVRSRLERMRERVKR